jgi:hypothetical protein
MEAESLMPRALPAKPRFKDDDVVVAWQAFAIDVDGFPFTFKTGARLRGNHPAVRAAPWAWVADGTPASEWPSVFEQSIEFPQPEPHIRILESIPPERAVRARQSFTFDVHGVAGSTVRQGQLLDMDDPIVQSNPELFERPPRPLSEERN